MSISIRERFLGICRFERPGDLLQMSPYPNIFQEEFLAKWIEHGAPKELIPKFGEPVWGGRFLRDYFDFESVRWLAEVKSGISLGGNKDASPALTDLGHGIKVPSQVGQLFMPAFEPRLISEDERSVTLVNGAGQTVRRLKEAMKMGWGMPTYLDWPVKDKATWNECKKRLDPTTPERWPADWDAYVKKINKIGEETPIILEVGGLYWFLREWVGSEQVLYMFYDNPVLIEEMVEQILYLETEIIKRVLKDIRVDWAYFAEDMSYKSGPLISPAMVRKFIMPRWKKITDLLRSNGVDIIEVDSDGNVEELIPLWIESGINFHWPFEVAAGNDAVAIRKKYGKDLIIGGTIDKRALIKGKEAIREEVMSKVPFLLETGGYFPSVDHEVPPDVTFENFCYYINLLREIAGMEKLSF